MEPITKPVERGQLLVMLLPWSVCVCGYPHMESALRTPDRPWWNSVKDVACPQCGGGYALNDGLG